MTLSSRLRNGNISLNDAITSGQIPDFLLHLFACDCAERYLRWERKAGREPVSRSWRAVAVVRRYARRGTTDAASEPTSKAAWAAWGAACGSAKAAGKVASAAREAERSWQTSHLADLLDWSEDVRPSLLRILYSREQQLLQQQKAWEKWTSQVEEGLMG